MYSFTIPGRLPGMNEYITALNHNRYTGAEMRSDSIQLVRACIARADIPHNLRPPVRLHYIFYEPNRRRDHDNVSGYAHKVIQDALVRAKVINNDGWGWVAGYIDDFDVDKESPRIEVRIEGVGK